MKIGEEVGLSDRFGTPITNGCRVEVLTGFNRTFKGHIYRCVWNIAQHRWGFDIEGYGKVENPSKSADCNFYATPRNAKNLKVI